MPLIYLNCPHCGVKLAVKDEKRRPFVRCGRCKTKFPMEPPEPEAEPEMENLVADWLSDGEDDAGDLPDETSLTAAIEGGGADGAEDDEPPSARTLHGAVAEPDAAGGRLRIVQVDSHGVLLEFPAARLKDSQFRSAFPRQCVSCDSRSHLRAHVVIFASELTDSVSLEDEHSAGPLMLSNEEVRGLSNQEVLSRLSKVPNVPPPADVPMPYWVCDMCSGSGAVSGQIKVNPDTGKGSCRMRIRHPRRALAFAEAAGGDRTEGLHKLTELLEKTRENPWDALPEVVQHRVEQWYIPEPGERFLAYVPDRDHARTEDGMAGVVVSDKRLIYHTHRRHRELAAGEPLELEHSTGGGKGNVSITTENWSIKHMTVDRDGILRFRRALSLGPFKPVWH